MNRKYRMTIAYDGTHYSGWQIQPNAKTIQEEIETALLTFMKEPITVVGSGRTDAGVHAHGQVAHFSTSKTIDPYRFLLSINSILSRDIRVKDVEEVPDDFHAQYSATGKIYHYNLYLNNVQDPFERLYQHLVYQKIDLDLLKKAANCFVGTHDFSSFANDQTKGSAARNPIRTIKRIDVVGEGKKVRLEFEADGFLYKMVRNITGTILEAARGKRSIDEIKEILEVRDRRKAGIAAPPRGLFLVKVHYDSVTSTTRHPE